jgi:outer membrane protein OmpA-like peptidoglycan-associated protein
MQTWSYADSTVASNSERSKNPPEETLKKIPTLAGAHPESTSTEVAIGMAEVPTLPIPRVDSVDSVESSTESMRFIPLDHVFFDHNKATLDPRSIKILDEAAQYILASNNIKRIIIYGHASSIASKDYNDRLSAKRANAVKNYLLKKKIPAESIWTMGWGEDDPIDENWTRAGSQRNRHVEIYLVQLNPKQ